MRELSAAQRRFVMARVQYGGNQGQAARMAGYSDHLGNDRVAGHLLMQNENVLAAIREVSGKTLMFGTIMAANVLVEMLQRDDVEPKDKLKAAGMLLDRTGFGAAQTINVNKTTTDRSGKAIMERLKELAAKHGMDPMKLIGGEEGKVAAPGPSVPAVNWAAAGDGKEVPVVTIEGEIADDG